MYSTEKTFLREKSPENHMFIRYTDSSYVDHEHRYETCQQNSPSLPKYILSFDRDLLTTISTNVHVFIFF